MSPIKIAVDAGHGYETAGKRTPPMPKDIDINKYSILLQESVYISTVYIRQIQDVLRFHKAEA